MIASGLGLLLFLHVLAVAPHNLDWSACGSTKICFVPPDCGSWAASQELVVRQSNDACDQGIIIEEKSNREWRVELRITDVKSNSLTLNLACKGVKFSTTVTDKDVSDCGAIEELDPGSITNGELYGNIKWTSLQQETIIDHLNRSPSLSINGYFTLKFATVEGALDSLPCPPITQHSCPIGCEPITGTKSRVECASKSLDLMIGSTGEWSKVQSLNCSHGRWTDDTLRAVDPASRAVCIKETCSSCTLKDKNLEEGRSLKSGCAVVEACPGGKPILAEGKQVGKISCQWSKEELKQDWRDPAGVVVKEPMCEALPASFDYVMYIVVPLGVILLVGGAIGVGVFYGVRKYRISKKLKVVEDVPTDFELPELPWNEQAIWSAYNTDRTTAKSRILNFLRPYWRIGPKGMTREYNRIPEEVVERRPPGDMFLDASPLKKTKLLGKHIVLKEPFKHELEDFWVTIEKYKVDTIVILGRTKETKWGPGEQEPKGILEPVKGDGVRVRYIPDAIGEECEAYQYKIKVTTKDPFHPDCTTLRRDDIEIARKVGAQKIAKDAADEKTAKDAADEKTAKDSADENIAKDAADEKTAREDADEEIAKDTVITKTCRIQVDEWEFARWCPMVGQKQNNKSLVRVEGMSPRIYFSSCGKEKTIVVLSENGKGRTGTYILCGAALHAIMNTNVEKDRPPSLKKLLLRLRAEVPSAVKTPQQYASIPIQIGQYAKRMGLLDPVDVMMLAQFEGKFKRMFKLFPSEYIKAE